MRGDQPVVSAASWIVRPSIRAPTLPRLCQGWAGLSEQLALRRSIALDWRRVDAVERREVDRHEVAEQDRATGRALHVSPRSATGSTVVAGWAIRQPSGSIRRRVRSSMLAVVEEDRAHATELGGPVPAADLVVVALGELRRRSAGSFAFSLSWFFQRFATARSGPRRRSRASSRGARARAPSPRESSGASGPHSSASVASSGCGGLELGAQRAARRRRRPRTRAPRPPCRRPRRAAASRPGRRSPARPPRARARRACRPS